MPVAEQTRVKTHTGNGSTTNFAYDFRILDDADLQVTVDGVLQTLTTDYTVNGAGDAGGGSIDFVTAPVNLSVVTIAGELPYDRDTDYIQNGGIRSQTVDDDFDKTIMLVQQLRRDIARAIKVPIEETDDKEVSSTAAQRANKVLAFDAAGLPVASALTDLSTLLSTVDASLVLAASELSVARPNRFCVAGGTVDALTGVTSPVAGALVNGLKVTVEASGANATTTPTFDLDTLGAKTIVKDNDIALLAGDIPGANAYLVLVYDSSLDKWVLLNPASAPGVNSIKGGIQDNSYIYAAATGSVNAMVAAFSPTLTGLTEGMGLLVKVNLANTITAPTINPDTLGAKTIIAVDGGPIAIGDLPAGHYAELIYDGTNFVLQNPALASSNIIALRDFARGLVCSRPTVATVDIDADEIVLQNVNGFTKRVSSVNLTANITASEANGLDTGSEANSTWYFVFVIYNPATDTTAALLSVSSTAPTMPSGYTHKALVSAVRNDSGGDILDFSQVDKEVLFLDLQAVFTTATANAWTTTGSLAAFLPSTARRAIFYLTSIDGIGGISPRSDGKTGQYECQASGAATTFGGLFSTSENSHTRLECEYADPLYYYAGSTLADGYVQGFIL